MTVGGGPVHRYLFRHYWSLKLDEDVDYSLGIQTFIILQLSGRKEARLEAVGQFTDDSFVNIDLWDYRHPSSYDFVITKRGLAGGRPIRPHVFLVNVGTWNFDVWSLMMAATDKFRWVVHSCRRAAWVRLSTRLSNAKLRTSDFVIPRIWNKKAAVRLIYEIRGCVASVGKHTYLERVD